MNTDQLIGYCTHAMLLCLYISVPIVATSALVGLLVSFVQAITSLQDQTISHVAKLIAAVIAIGVIMPMAGAALLRFSTEMLSVALSGRAG